MPFSVCSTILHNYLEVDGDWSTPRSIHYILQIFFYLLCAAHLLGAADNSVEADIYGFLFLRRYIWFFPRLPFFREPYNFKRNVNVM